MQIRRKILRGEYKFPSCRYVIIDTDAGGDDVQAILYAISEAKKQGKTILGITCIDGNTTVEHVAANVNITQILAGSKIPIYKGRVFLNLGSPTNFPCNTYKDHYFEVDGFGGKQAEYIARLKVENKWNLELIQKQNALEFLIDSANKYAGDLAIIALGPLTNLAMAYHLDNSFPSKVPMLSLMGGSLSGFGIRDFFAAEFNFHLDAEAAFVAFEVFPLIVVLAFDVSLDLGSTATISLFEDDTRVLGKMIHDIHGEIMKTHRPSVCDPLACIPVFNPEIVEGIYQAYGRIEIAGERTSGLLMLDWFESEPEKKERSKIWAVSGIDLPALMARISDSYN
jgi:inosine-uridine nucleoside N-ribohydrolase